MPRTDSNFFNIVPVSDLQKAFFRCNNMPSYHEKDIHMLFVFYQEAVNYCKEKYNSTIRTHFSRQSKSIIAAKKDLTFSGEKHCCNPKNIFKSKWQQGKNNLRFNKKYHKKPISFWVSARRFNSTHIVDEENKITVLQPMYRHFPSTVCMQDNWRLINKYPEIGGHGSTGIDCFCCYDFNRRLVLFILIGW